MLSKTATLSLLSIPQNSQLIQHLGPTWCDSQILGEGLSSVPMSSCKALHDMSIGVSNHQKHAGTKKFGGETRSHRAGHYHVHSHRTHHQIQANPWWMGAWHASRALLNAGRRSRTPYLGDVKPPQTQGRASRSEGCLLCPIFRIPADA
jgi:hypothetical protein